MHLLWVFSFLDHGIFSTMEEIMDMLEFDSNGKEETKLSFELLPYVRIGIKIRLPCQLAVFIILIYSHLLHFSNDGDST